MVLDTEDATQLREDKRSTVTDVREGYIDLVGTTYITHDILDGLHAQFTSILRIFVQFNNGGPGIHFGHLCIQFPYLIHGKGRELADVGHLLFPFRVGVDCRASGHDKPGDSSSCTSNRGTPFIDTPIDALKQCFGVPELCIYAVKFRFHRLDFGHLSRPSLAAPLNPVELTAK